MSILTYSLAALTTYLGLIAGMIIAFSAEEELKPGRKYFEVLKHACLILLFSALIFSLFKNNMVLELITAIILFLILCFMCYYFGARLKLLKIKKEPKIKQYIVYAELAIAFYLSSKLPNIFIIIPSLILIYGIPAGTMLTEPKKKAESFRKILTFLFYPALAIILKLVLL